MILFVCVPVAAQARVFHQIDVIVGSCEFTLWFSLPGKNVDYRSLGPLLRARLKQIKLYFLVFSIWYTFKAVLFCISIQSISK